MRRLLLFLLMCVSFAATAQDFEILFVNTGTIKIGGKDLRRGDVFYESDKISWKDDRQVMKVLSLSDYKQYVLASPDFKQKKFQTVKDYLVRTNRMSTRGSGNLSSVARQLGNTVYVVDTTRIPVAYQPDESEYFFLVSSGKRFDLGYEDGHLVLSPDIWEGESPVTCELHFHFSDGEEECVTEELSIIPLPKEIPGRNRKWWWMR